MDYYNEWDKFAAAWLRELIAAGHLPEGIVDERDIRTVKAEELKGYRQVHLFAGIGGWPLALKLAGWPEDRPVWTGSCPCQPFSVAGKAGGVGDERHLWPAFHRLISECHPSVIFGEQVESKDGRYWLAGVRDDLERLGYAVGAADLCAAGVGAPHRRQRLYWVADSNSGGRWPDGKSGGLPQVHPAGADQRMSPAGAGPFSRTDRLGISIEPGLEGHAGNGDDGNESGRDGAVEAGPASEAGASGGMGNAQGRGRGVGRDAPQGEQGGHAVGAGGAGLGGLADADGEQAHAADTRRLYAESFGGSRANPWSDSRIILCRDGKYRRVPAEPILFIESHGISCIMGTLWDKCLTEIKAQVTAHADAARVDPGEILYAMWRAVAAKTLWTDEATGGDRQLPQEVLLLFALCQLARDVGGKLIRTASGLAPEEEITLRILREEAPQVTTSPCSPYRRQLEKPRSEEPTDALRRMPPFDAQSKTEEAMQALSAGCSKTRNVPEALSAVEEIWRRAVDEDAQQGHLARFPAGAISLRAALGFPLAPRLPGRLGLLRGAGGSIVPQVAAEFVRAFMETSLFVLLLVPWWVLA